MILDCCYSGSGTRQPEYMPTRLERGFELDSDVAIPSTLDHNIWSAVYGDRASAVPSGFAQSGTRSHVLLAACDEEGRAYEVNHRGMFTQALLEELRKVKTDKISYRDLMRRIVIPQ